MTRAAAATPPTTTTTARAKGVPLRRELLTRDPGVQSRTQLDPKTVERYADLMKDGVKFPALVVFADGDKLYLADAPRTGRV